MLSIASVFNSDNINFQDR